MLFQFTDAVQHSEESVSTSAVSFLVFYSLQPFSGLTKRYTYSPFPNLNNTMNANAGVSAHPHLIFN